MIIKGKWQDAINQIQDGIVYSKTTRYFCKLCLTEKLFMWNALGDDKCLNKKTELSNKCRDQNKLLLKKIKDTMDENTVGVHETQVVYLSGLVF